MDFDEQPVAQLADGALRPDVVVRLPGGKTVLLDSKVPLEAYLRAIDAPEEERATHLRAHATQLRAHVDALSRKQYWEAFAGSPEMAVLFLPSDGLLAAAVEADPSLHEDAFARRIVLATPATLFALLLTIAHVWKQDAIAVNAREIANEGRELHKRIADLSRHLAKLGRALESALKTYNGAVGSFDSRLLPAARRFRRAGGERGRRATRSRSRRWRSCRGCRAHQAKKDWTTQTEPTQAACPATVCRGVVVACSTVAAHAPFGSVRRAQGFAGVKRNGGSNASQIGCCGLHSRHGRLRRR